MSVRLKIIVAALGAMFVLLLMLLWATFVFLSRTPIDPFINQISALITIVVGLIAAFFGHQSALNRAGIPAAPLVAADPDQIPPVASLPADPVVDAGAQPGSVSMAPGAAATLQ